MSKVADLSALARDRVGKGAARAVRREGRIPAIIYGGKETPTPISLEPGELMRAYNTGRFFTTVFNLSVTGGKGTQVIARDVQLHPVTDRPIHVDFFRLTKGARITVEVQVHFLNEEESPGLKRGGVLNIVRHEVELEVPADNIPDYLEADLTGLEIGDSIHISAITLPEGAKPTITDRDFTIATIAAPSALRSEEGEAAEAAAEEEEAAAAEDKEEESKDEE
jgi:large subunit ribosomal protein L25